MENDPTKIKFGMKDFMSWPTNIRKQLRSANCRQLGEMYTQIKVDTIRVKRDDFNEPPLRTVVAFDESGNVIGWLSFKETPYRRKYRGKPLLDSDHGINVYVKQKYRRQGIGSNLIQVLRHHYHIPRSCHTFKETPVSYKFYNKNGI